MWFNDGREYDGKRAYKLARKLLDNEIDGPGNQEEVSYSQEAFYKNRTI
jgi:hypothetical protein